MTHPPYRELADIAAQLESAIAQPDAEQQRLLHRLREQRQRLDNVAFQLAVLGQFKRGKSTLLNAFVGYPLLSTGVLPLTAVPTFVSQSPTTQIQLKSLSGVEETFRVPGLDALAIEVAAATTEEQNPHNQKALQKVEVGIPGRRWLEGIVLVDTPGIGSTNIHNTNAAHEALPECDAALFVTSVDPPITEVELRYLAAICRTASRVVVVLNKVDLVDGEDVQKTLGFLSSVLAEQGHPQLDPKIFPISARLALSARRQNDNDALRKSGILALEDHIRSELASQKSEFLKLSIAKKMSDIVDKLQIGAALMVRALTLPISELDEKVSLFESASVDFERERNNLEDRLTGEWRRAISRLDHLCEDADTRVQQELVGPIAKISKFAHAHGAQSNIELAMAAAFDRELNAIAARINEELASAISIHKESFRALAERVASTSTELFGINSQPSSPEEWFHVERKPYWVGKMQVETSISLTVDGLARLLPRKLRERRELGKLRAGVTKAVMRNISDLHWTMRQNIDDSFRRLLAASNDMVQSSIISTNELLKMARERRRSADSSVRLQVEQARRTQHRLAELREALDRHSQPSLPQGERP